MKQAFKQVTPREFYNILRDIRAEAGLEYPTYEKFLYQLSETFLTSPTLEMRFHWIDKDQCLDIIYIIDNKSLADAIQEIK